MGFTSQSIMAQNAPVLKNNWWHVNGQVFSIHETNNKVYVGGDFDEVIFPKERLALVNMNDGMPQSHFPSVTGNSVNAIIPDGRGGWYIGGDFTQVGGIPRANLARVNADGTVHPWNPSPNNPVFALAISGRSVMVGGSFSFIGGQARSFIAGIDTGTAVATSFNPGPNLNVRTIATKGDTVYFGGEFQSMTAAHRNFVAAALASTGDVLPWVANTNAAVRAIAIRDTNVFVGGDFTIISHDGTLVGKIKLAAVNSTTGAITSWTANANNATSSRVNSLLMVGSTLYVGGTFTTIGGQNIRYLAAVNALTAAVNTNFNMNPDCSIDAMGWIGNRLIVSGCFSGIGGVEITHIARITMISPSEFFASGFGFKVRGGINAIAAQNNNVSLCIGGSTDYMYISRGKGAAFDLATGAPLAWDPRASGPIYTIKPSGSDLFIGGGFTTVRGLARVGIAKVDTSGGGLLNWNAQLNNTVLSIIPQGNLVYVAGAFTTVNGINRPRLAALDSVTAVPTSWNPNPNNVVRVVEIRNNKMIVAGSFTQIGGQQRNNLASIDLTVGDADTWNPNANGSVRAFTINQNTMYIGGEFTQIGTQTRNRIAAIDLTTGAPTDWNPNADVMIQRLLIHGGTLYAGGSFSNIGGQSRTGFAALNLTTGNATSLNFNLTGPVTAIEANGSNFYIGGLFLSVSGVNRFNFAPFSICAPVNKTTTVSGATITANQSGAAYQWINCNNSNAPVAGATSQSFTPTESGRYAVIVNVNGCIDTSDCVQMTLTSVNEVANNNVLIYPNPATTQFTVANIAVGTRVVVIDITGKVMVDETTTENTHNIKTDNLAHGIYVVRLENKGITTQKKLLVEKY